MAKKPKVPAQPAQSIGVARLNTFADGWNMVQQITNAHTKSVSNMISSIKVSLSSISFLIKKEAAMNNITVILAKPMLIFKKSTPVNVKNSVIWM